MRVTTGPKLDREPRLLKVENTNDADQVSVTRFQSYDLYNNVTVMSVHDFAAAGTVGAEMKRVETTYETGAGWIDRWLVHLPKSFKTYQGTTIVSRTDYEYDYNGDQTQLTPRNDIGNGNFREYNPYLPPVQTCTGLDDPGESHASRLPAMMRERIIAGMLQKAGRTRRIRSILWRKRAC